MKSKSNGKDSRAAKAFPGSESQDASNRLHPVESPMLTKTLENTNCQIYRRLRRNDTDNSGWK